MVGLTGGLASGKSSVARLLAQRGVPCLDADRVVHDLYLPGGDGAEAVRALFGQRVMASDGGVDRRRLGELVLGDAAAREALERAVHPLVRAWIADWVEDLAAAIPAPPVAVVEAALLVETGAAAGYRLLVVVWCRPEQQLARAMARGMSAERARALLAAQLPLDDKRAVADVAIDNSGPPEALAEATAEAWRLVVEGCRRGRAGGPAGSEGGR